VLASNFILKDSFKIEFWTCFDKTLDLQDKTENSFIIYMYNETKPKF
jgi:hypothetical protein